MPKNQSKLSPYRRALKRAVDHAGGEAELGRLLSPKRSWQAINKWRYSARPLPIWYAKQLEEIMPEIVKARQLRPDHFKT